MHNGNLRTESRCVCIRVHTPILQYPWGMGSSTTTTPLDTTVNQGLKSFVPNSAAFLSRYHSLSSHLNNL